jgi:hypothetical protein
MPSDIRIIHAHDFIKATPEGQIDLEESSRMLNEIASASGPKFDYDIIVDTRKAQMALSVTELWYLAAELSDFRKVFLRKTAILCPLEEFDRAAFFAICAENRGFLIEAFTSFEDAIEWLCACEI